MAGSCQRLNSRALNDLGEFLRAETGKIQKIYLGIFARPWRKA